MTRLIDAEELKEYLEEAYEAGCINKYYNMQRRTIFDEVFDCIDEQPAVDAVRVIRCKDCNYHFYENDNIPYCANIDYGYGWRDEDYCSYAERKEE